MKFLPLVPLFVGVIFTPLAAQNLTTTLAPSDAWLSVEIISGAAFRGDGSVTLETGTGGLPVLAFWRPILFKEDSRRSIAGRMDCRVVASDEPFTDDAFDPDTMYDSVTETRERQGIIDEDKLRDIGEHTKQLDVVGRHNAPRQHYVLSYIMVRDGERLIDIRRNCTFVHGDGISRIDALPYIYRYTKLTYAFEPNDGRRPLGEG